MKINMEALIKMAGVGGVTHFGMQGNTIPGIHNIRHNHLKVFRYDGTEMMVSAFSDEGCKLHQNMVRVSSPGKLPSWEPMTSFYSEDPYAGLAEYLGVECAMPGLASA